MQVVHISTRDMVMLVYGFIYGQIHTPGYPFVENQPMSLSNPTSLDSNAAPDDFIPYNAIFTRINVPSSSPNYGPINVQIFIY